jgi:hypothetical protein
MPHSPVWVIGVSGCKSGVRCMPLRERRILVDRRSDQRMPKPQSVLVNSDQVCRHGSGEVTDLH